MGRPSADIDNAGSTTDGAAPPVEMGQTFVGE